MMAMMKRISAYLICIALLASIVPSMAQAQSKAPLASVSATIAPAVGDRAGPTIEIVLDIPPGLHAQSRTPLDPNLIRLDVKLDPAPAGVTVGEAVYPPGEEKTYPMLGKLSVYQGRVVVRVPLSINPAVAPAEVVIKGKIRYQLCTDDLCYPPKNAAFDATAVVASLNVTTPATRAVEPGVPKVESVAPKVESVAPNIESVVPSIESVVPSIVEIPTTQSSLVAPALVVPAQQWSVVTAFGFAMLAGLLFNIMPCVLPVLPLKAMGFYEVAQHRRLQSILYGLAFSAGVIAIFGVLAVLVLVLKVVSWGSLFSHGWFVWSIVVLLVLMSIGLFGVFTVNLPVAAYSFSPRHDTYTGNLMWGGLTAVLATPCTAPLLPGVLLWAVAQPTLLGMGAMLMVGVGMSLPYVFLSAFPELARRFPRTGPWPELFKQMMGFMILGTAVYFGAGRLIHGPAFMWPVCAVAAVACLYLMARTVQLSKNATPVAVSSVLCVVALGATFYWTATLNGLLLGPAQTSASAPAAGWTAYSDDAFARARASDAPILVKFTANWCATCQYIEGTVFRDANVLQQLKDANITLIKVDLSDAGAPGEDLLLKLNPAGGIPLTAIYSAGQDQPTLLSSVYTSQTLLDAIALVTRK